MTEFGEYIPLFGIDHILYICILMISALWMYKEKKFIKKYEKGFTVILFIVSLVQQILLYGSYFILFEFDLGESLPLHISRINSILIMAFLLTKNRKLYAVICYFSLFAWLTFLYPSRVYGITHPIGISFIINHVITLLFPYYARAAYSVELKKGDKSFAYKWFLLYLFIVSIINPLVDGNYFYFKYKPIFPEMANYIFIPLVLVFVYMLFSLGEIIFKKIAKE